MKKRIGLIIISSFVIILGVLFFNKDFIKEHKINSVLKNEYYSYLPQEIKEDIKDVYLESGIIVKTEKNKEINVPYINPKYVEYKSLSKEEQEKVDLIPEIYSVDYDYRELKSEEGLPSSFDLRTGNYLTPMKDQGQTGLCWAFTGVEQAESFLMYKNNQAYNSSSKIFSPRQIDYATSANGIKDYTNPYGNRTLKTDGGNFGKFSVLASYGLSLIDESKMPFDESTDQKELNEVLNFNNSNYEVTEAVDLPSIAAIQLNDNTYMNECNNAQNLSECLDEQEQTIKNLYMEAIKETVMDNGGALVSAVTPQGKCGYANSDGQKALSIHSSCYSSNDGHALQVIGWDDNYSYSYCKTSTGNTSVNSNGNCSSGTKVTGTGAFILRNSWGDSTTYKYLYLTYDSVSADTSSPTFSSITDMTGTKDWDNLYNGTYSIENAFSFGASSTTTFTKKITGNEILKKIKFHSITANNTFNVIIKDGNNTYTYNDVLTEELPGLYTVDLSDKNITLTNDSFSVTVGEKTNRYSVISNSISVFTSNVSTTPQIKSSVDSLTFDTTTSNLSTRLYSITKNIPTDQLVTYTLKNKNNENVTSYLTIENNKVSQNDVNTSLSIGENTPPGQYSLTLSYSSGSETIPLKVIGDTVYVYYMSNDGTTTSTSQEVVKNQSFTLDQNPYSRIGYTFNNWNTKQDGTGTSYNDRATINGISDDLTLYAEWQPITYKIRFDNNTGSGTMSDQTVTYDKTQFLTKSTFTKENYNFVSWNTKADGTGTSYGDEEGILNLSSTQDEVITLYAEWQRYAYHVNFFANDGTDNTQSQQMIINTPTALAGNAFSKPNYEFAGWNTEPDGTGTTYTDGQVVTLTNSDLNLYAQWRVITYTVTFNPNSGTPSTPTTQTFSSGEDFQLNANPFTKTGYTFKRWNTNSSGTGTNYDDQASLNLNRNLVLYAQWQPITYIVRFNSNEGTGTMEDQTFTYNQSQKLSKNTFTKQNYEFTAWTTNPNETGTMYEDEQTVSNLSSTQGEVFNLYANWERVSYNVNFYSNDGTNRSNIQEVPINTSTNLDSNTYTRPGFEFTGWNTKADGTGISYTNNQTVTLTNSDLDLYAQWQANTYTVYFNANSGTGSMTNQTMTYDQNATLKANTFTKTGYTFAGWNTEADGTGTSYSNQQSVMNLTTGSSVTLYAQWEKEEALPLSVAYKTHVQSYGWQRYVYNGKMSGTEGEAKRLEGIKIKLLNQPYEGDIEYRTHIQSYGWETIWRKNDEFSGTEGEAKRLEAIEIRLTGDMAEHYDVYYRVHAQTFGWLGWAKNGESAGTAGYAKRLEGIEIVVVEKGQTPEGYDSNVKAFRKKLIEYRTHVQTYGWQEFVSDGAMSGTSGEAKRLEGIEILLRNQDYEGNVEYSTHVQTYGWQDYVSNGQMSGTSGEAKRLEAIQIRLTGEMAEHFDIYYRVHAQSYGWLGWASNDSPAGTAGLAKRLEGIEIVLVEKGEDPPERDNQDNVKAYIENN